MAVTTSQQDIENCFNVNAAAPSNADLINVANLYTVLRAVLPLAGTVDPSASSGVDAPVGKIYLRSTGTVWTKTGAAATQWTINAA